MDCIEQWIGWVLTLGRLIWSSMTHIISTLQNHFSRKPRFLLLSLLADSLVPVTSTTSSIMNSKCPLVRISHRRVSKRLPNIALRCLTATASCKSGPLLARTPCPSHHASQNCRSSYWPLPPLPPRHLLIPNACSTSCVTLSSLPLFPAALHPLSWLDTNRSQLSCLPN